MAATEWYVDPLNGSDSTGDGTSEGTAWKSLKYAIENHTFTNNDGDTINVKDSATDTLTGAISYARVANTRHLEIIGYSSTVGDSGRATIDTNGYQIFNGQEIFIKNMKFTNSSGTATTCIGTITGQVIDNCEFTGNYTYAIYSYTKDYVSIQNCQFSNAGIGIYTYSSATKGGTTIRNNHFSNDIDTLTTAIDINYTDGVDITGNTFNLTGTTDAIHVAQTSSYGTVIENNSFFTTGTGTAIDIDTNYQTSVNNNIIEGFNYGIDAGTSGATSLTSIQSNFFYDNTTDIRSTTYTIGIIYRGNHLAASGSGFAKTGSNTVSNRAVYFAPTGDCIAGSADGIHAIGALPEVSSAGGGLIQSPGMAGGMNG